MTASTAATVSPSSVRIARKTPWADGCCGPMFIVRRSLPPYPSSTTLRASGSAIGTPRLLHRRVGRGVQDDRLHLHEERRGLAEERLPLGILDHLAPGRRAVVEVAVRPHVDDLVQL